MTTFAPDLLLTAPSAAPAGGSPLASGSPVGRLATPSATRPSGAAALAVALTLRADLWEPLVRFRSHERFTRLIEPTEAAAVLAPELHDELADAQIWLLTWLPGQGTVLHDHGDAAGSFAVARGTLSERVVAGRVGSVVRQSRIDLPAGRVRYFGEHYLHQVTNSFDEPAVSIHVYRPGLRWMNSYDVVDDVLVHVGADHAGVDW